MRFRRLRSARFAVVVAAVAAACGGGRADAPIVQPGAPGQRPRLISAGAAADLAGVSHTPADVRFMQGMMRHHAQALQMTSLVASRTTREDLRLLAKRIDVSQADEIKMMREWLGARGVPVPGEHGAHGAAADAMPGMLTAEEMSALENAQGAAFDRLFLELMIKHHEGAVAMVAELFASPGAGQESDIFAFASDVTADQQMEIARMKGMIDAR
jgi:uncharacterized protein (DUF305 family)